MAKSKKSKKKKEKMVKVVSRLLDGSGTGSLSVVRGGLIQGLARGTAPVRMKRTHKHDRVEALQAQEQRLTQSSEYAGSYGMLPYQDSQISNLEQSIRGIRASTKDSLPAQILINMVQQQAQSQNLITNLQRDTQENFQDLSSLAMRVGSREPSIASPSRSRTRERSPEPDVMSDDEKPSGLARARRNWKFLSKTDMKKIKPGDYTAIGLNDDTQYLPVEARQEILRRRIRELGITPTLTTGRRVDATALIDEAKYRHAQNQERISNRRDSIRNTEPPETPASNNPTDAEYSDPEEPTEFP